MKKLPLLAAAAALVLVSGARADDPPPTKPAAPPPAAPAKHENKVSPEATAAYEKMEKTANHVTAKEATGSILSQMPGGDGPMATKFTFKAPGDIKIEDAAGKGGGKGRGQGMGRGGPGQAAQTVLRYAVGAFRPASDAEYDAEIVKKDGKDVLSVTMFKAGEQMAHTDYVLDANGLAATATSTRSQTDKSGQKHEMKTEFAFTWTKSGETFRLDKMQVTGPMGTMTSEIAYVDAGGFSFPSGWKSVSDKFTAESHVADLVVDGKKIETPAVEPRPEAKKTGKKGKDGDGEDDDDEKEGGKEKK